MPFLSWRPLNLLAYDADAGQQIAPTDKPPCKKIYGLERDHKGRLRLASRINKPGGDDTKKGGDQAKPKEAAGKDQNNKKDANQNDKPEKAKDGKQDKAKDENKQDKSKEENNQDKSKEENNQDKSKDDSGWTDEQDKKMLELKKEDPAMQWAKVGEQVGHTAAQCKDRMKELKLRESGNEAEAKKDDKKDGKEDDKKSTHSKASKANDNKQKGKDAKTENKKHEKDGKKAGSKAGSDKEPRYTAAQWLAMQDDQIFNLDEQKFLVELMRKDSEQSWLRLASRFHDATGRRVHPEDIREKMHQIYD